MGCYMLVYARFKGQPEECNVFLKLWPLNSTVTS